MKSISNIQPGLPMKKILPCYETRIIHKGRRKTNNPIANSKEMFSLFRTYFSGLDREHMVVLYLDSAHRPMGYKVESVGTSAACLLDMRLFVRDALLTGAVSIALAHNHLSDACRPSPEDRNLTEHATKACSLVGLRFLDHLIITTDDYFSFADHDLVRLPQRILKRGSSYRLRKTGRTDPTKESKK